MKIYHELARENDRPLVLAIGFFDGMHRGHQEIAKAARRMRRPGYRAGVLTFANHPAAFLRPGTEPPLLMTMQERVVAFAEAGFEECFLVRFDEHVATLSPEAFLAKLDALGVRGAAVGANFHFGHKRSGDAATMGAHFATRGVPFAAVENALHDGERISSTRIRALVAEGNVEVADYLLGRSYELRGVVELGFGRGHDLNFPTANLSVPKKLLPKDGVYAAVARVDGRDHAALVSIGTNPQFEGKERTIEAWLRDFHETIYGHEVVLREMRYVREQRLFSSIDELVAQMRRDVEAVAFPSYG